MRRLFAKDMLDLLEQGDCADRYHACEALTFVNSRGLGRFQDAIVKQLARVAKQVTVHSEARAEAVEALMHLLPTNAAKRYPFLMVLMGRLHQYESDRDVHPIVRAKVAELIDQLDDTIVTVSI